MTNDSVVIHRVTELDLTWDDWVWPFAQARRAEIDAHFAARQAAKPKLFNGTVLLGRAAVFAGDRLTCKFFKTDFASFLSWRDWGCPDDSVFNGFGMGVLRSSDGAFALGEMAQHTANAGRIYFPGGTPDPSDLRGDRLDIASSVAREIEEETGLSVTEYRAAEHWDCAVTGANIAMLRVLDVDLPGQALREKIEANLSLQRLPELSAIHLVRGRQDFTAAMPRFVTAFIDHDTASSF